MLKFYRRLLIPKGTAQIDIHPEDLEAINGVIAYLRILNVPLKPEKPAILTRVNLRTIQIRDPFLDIIAKRHGDHFRIIDVDVKTELDFFPHSLFSLKYLKELGFKCSNVGTIDEIPSLNCTHLRSLYMQADKGHFLPLEQLHSLGMLEHLFLYICIPNNSMDLKRFPYLKSIGIKTASLAIDEDFPDWIQNVSIQDADVKITHPKESIVYLRLTNCKINDVWLPEIFPQLKRLSIVSSTFESDQVGIEHLQELVFLELDNTNLTEINLQNTPLMFVILKNLQWKYLPPIPEYLFALHLISLPNLRVPTWVRKHVSSSMALLVTNCKFE